MSNVYKSINSQQQRYHHLSEIEFHGAPFYALDGTFNRIHSEWCFWIAILIQNEKESMVYLNIMIVYDFISPNETPDMDDVSHVFIDCNF